MNCYVSSFYYPTEPTMDGKLVASSSAELHLEDTHDCAKGLPVAHHDDGCDSVTQCAFKQPKHIVQEPDMTSKLSKIKDSVNSFYCDIDNIPLAYTLQYTVKNSAQSNTNEEPQVTHSSVSGVPEVIIPASSNERVPLQAASSCSKYVWNTQDKWKTQVMDSLDIPDFASSPNTNIENSGSTDIKINLDAHPLPCKQSHNEPTVAKISPILNGIYQRYGGGQRAQEESVYLGIPNDLMFACPGQREQTFESFNYTKYPDLSIDSELAESSYSCRTALEGPLFHSRFSGQLSKQLLDLRKTTDFNLQPTQTKSTKVSSEIGNAFRPVGIGCSSEYQFENLNDLVSCVDIKE